VRLAVRLSKAAFYFILLICGWLTTTACERPSRVLATRWHGNTPMPAVPSLQGQETKLQIGTEQMRLQRQQVDGVPVEGAFLKILQKDGREQFMSYRILDEKTLRLKSQIPHLKAQSKGILEKIESRYTGFREMKWQSGPELKILMDPKARLVWETIYESKSRELLALVVDEKLKLVEITPLGSRFAEATASLFPKGPLKSDVSDVRLKNLLNGTHLESEQVLVKTEAESVAIGEKNQFRYASEDIRFSQVQAYYFVAESLQWFQKNFQLSLPFRIEVETQKGYPSKLNTAFYYKQKIRLGEGDDLLYSRIPLDPSIVVHESVHAVIEAVAGLPYEGEGGSLNEAYADFMTALQLENPRLGEASYRKEPFKRNIENEFKYSEKNGGLYHDSLLVSGLLWNLRNELGPAFSQRLAWKALLHLGPDSNFQTWIEELNQALLLETPEAQNRVKAIMKARGWNENEIPQTQKENL
jgi:Zn-dependent metalloprotease